MIKEISVIIFALIFSISGIAQTVKVPCALFPDISDNFSPSRPDYYQYQVDYEICRS